MKAKKKVTKAPAGNKLTARERKHIKELRSILSGKGRKGKAPLTAQKSITFIMYPIRWTKQEEGIS